MTRSYRIEHITQERCYFFLMCAYSNTPDIQVLEASFRVIELKLNLGHLFISRQDTRPEMDQGVCEFIRTFGAPSIIDRRSSITTRSLLSSLNKIDELLEFAS